MRRTTKVLEAKADSRVSRRRERTYLHHAVLILRLYNTGIISVLPVIAGGQMALIKREAQRHIERTIRDIDEVLEGDEPLTASEEAELTYFSWHLIAR